MPEPTHTCPACGEAFTPKVEPEYNLAPTGGDYDWCEGRQTIACPTCAQELIATVRTWRGGRGTECLSLVVAPPPPHPFCSAVELAFSPSGSRLAVRPLGGPDWLVALDSPARALRLPGDHWPLCWSEDEQRIFVRNKGDIHSTGNGQVLASIPWPFVRSWDPEASSNPLGYRTESDLRAAAFVGDTHLAVESSSVLEEHATHVDLISLDGTPPFGLLSHRGSGNMDGAASFAPDGRRLLHWCATSHGTARFILSLYDIEPTANPPIRLRARVEHEGLDLQRLCWLPDGDLLAAFDPRCWGRLHTKMPYGLVRLGGSDLHIHKRTEVIELPRPPDEEKPALYWPADIRALAVEEDGSILFGTDHIYRIAESDEGFVCRQRFDTGSPAPASAVAFHGPTSRAAFCREEEIYSVDLNSGHIEALGRRLSATLKTE